MDRLGVLVEMGAATYAMRHAILHHSGVLESIDKVQSVTPELRAEVKSKMVGDIEDVEGWLATVMDHLGIRAVRSCGLIFINVAACLEREVDRPQRIVVVKLSDVAGLDPAKPET